MAGSLASLRLAGCASSLAEALRLIGAAPAAGRARRRRIRRVEQAAREIGEPPAERPRAAAAAEMKETAERVRVESAGAHGDLAAMRTTRVGTLLERVGAAVSAQARREGREVRLGLLRRGRCHRSAGWPSSSSIRCLQLAREQPAGWWHGIELGARAGHARASRAPGSVHLGAQARSGGPAARRAGRRRRRRRRRRAAAAPWRRTTILARWSRRCRRSDAPVAALRPRLPPRGDSCRSARRLKASASISRSEARCTGWARHHPPRQRRLGMGLTANASTSPSSPASPRCWLARRPRARTFALPIQQTPPHPPRPCDPKGRGRRVRSSPACSGRLARRGASDAGELTIALRVRRPSGDRARALRAEVVEWGSETPAPVRHRPPLLGEPPRGAFDRRSGSIASAPSRR